MGLLRAFAIIGMTVLSGCASTAEYVESDFVRAPMEDFGMIGVRSSSEKSGKNFEIYGVCADGARQYVIRQVGTSASGSDGHWDAYANGVRLYKSDSAFTDREEFLQALTSLEVIKRAEGFSGEERMKVANPGSLKIPSLCEAKQAKNDAEASRRAEEAESKNSSLIHGVIERTGIQPMLSGRNEKDFNNLVTMFRSQGIDDFAGKFVWAEDGDYVVSQVLSGQVVLVSLTNPALFPPISILTDKQAIEGQRWSSVSRGPLQFVGPKQYQTALGVERQVLVFKAI